MALRRNLRAIVMAAVVIFVVLFAWKHVGRWLGIWQEREVLQPMDAAPLRSND